MNDCIFVRKLRKRKFDSLCTRYVRSLKRIQSPSFKTRANSELYHDSCLEFKTLPISILNHRHR